MKFVHLLKLMGLVVDLEEQTVLTSNVDVTNLGFLLEGVGIIEAVLKIKHCEDSVSSMMVEDDRGSCQALVLHTPKPDILLPT